MEKNIALSDGNPTTGIAKDAATTVVSLTGNNSSGNGDEDLVPVGLPPNHPEVADVELPDPVPPLKAARPQYVESLQRFFQQPAILLALVREVLPIDVQELILATLDAPNPPSASSYASHDSDEKVKAAVVNALPRYLAFVSQGVREVTGIHALPSDRTPAVFARRLQAFLNMRDMSDQNSKSLMDDWCDDWLQRPEVKDVADNALAHESRVVRTAVQESLPYYARSAMWTVYDSSNSGTRMPQLATQRFRRLWLLWLKLFQEADNDEPSSSAATRSSTAALVSNFRVLAKAYVAEGGAVGDLFNKEVSHFQYLRLDAQEMQSFAPMFQSLVQCFWAALKQLDNETARDVKELYAAEVRASIKRARVRKCCLWVSQSGVFWVLLTFIGVAITVGDQVTDIILGIEHARDGNPAWSFLTFFLACLPSALQGSLMIPNTRISRCFKRWNKVHTTLLNRLIKPADRLDRKCKRSPCSKPVLIIVLFYAGLLVVMVSIPMMTPAIVGLIALSPFFGLLFVMKWGWQYFRDSGTRVVLEANLRSYSIMETLLESVPQLLLQLYIYSIQDELHRLRLVDVAAVSLSLLAIFKTVLLGDMELHRNTQDQSARVPPLLVFTSLFRLVDVIVGLASTVVILVYLRQYVIWFFLASVICQASPISLAWGLCGSGYVFRCCLCVTTCCCGRASSSRTLSFGARRLKGADIIVFPLMLLCLALFPFFPVSFMTAFLIPFILHFICRTRDVSPAMDLFDWEQANESAMKKLMPIVEPVFSIPANWVLTSGVSYMLLVRRKEFYAEGSRLDVCRQSDIACRSSVRCSHEPQLFPPITTRIAALTLGFVVSYLIHKGVLHDDLLGTPMSEGYKLISQVSLYGCLPLIAALVFWTWVDMSKTGHRLVTACTRVDLLGRLFECCIRCCQGSRGASKVVPT